MDGEKRFDGIKKAELHELSTVKKVIAVVGGKGGVGKSSVCSMLAVTLQRKGYNVAILDADLTGPSVPKAFGLKGYCDGTSQGIYPIFTKTGIQVISMNLLLEKTTDPIIWRGPVLSEYVKSFYSKVVWTDVDYMFIDMPPGTGDVPLSVLQEIPVDGIVVVTAPQELAKDVTEKAINMAKTLNVPIYGVIENQTYFICKNCGKKHYVYGKGKSAEERFAIKTVAEIPIDKNLAYQTDHGLIELFEGDFLDEISDLIER